MKGLLLRRDITLYLGLLFCRFAHRGAAARFSRKALQMFHSSIMATVFTNLFRHYWDDKVTIDSTTLIELFIVVVFFAMTTFAFSIVSVLLPILLLLLPCCCVLLRFAIRSFLLTFNDPFT